MTREVLQTIPVLKDHVDERFLEHRRRSLSLAAIAGACMAAGIFEYRLITQHVISWDLLAVITVMVVTKFGMFIWYRMKG